MKNFKENSYENSEKKIDKAVVPMTVILALSQALSANPNTGTNINQTADDIFTNTQTKVEQNDIVNDKEVSDTDANFEDFIERDPKALQKAEKKINKAKKKIDLEDLALTTHEIDSLIDANIDIFQNIKSLNLGWSDLSTWVPQNIFKLKNLKSLNLSESNLPESITIPKWEYSLEEFTISFNKKLQKIIWIENILDNLNRFDRDGTKIKKNSITNDKILNKKLYKKLIKRIRNKEIKYR